MKKAVIYALACQTLLASTHAFSSEICSSEITAKGMQANFFLKSQSCQTSGCIKQLKNGTSVRLKPGNYEIAYIPPASMAKEEFTRSVVLFQKTKQGIGYAEEAIMLKRLELPADFDCTYLNNADRRGAIERSIDYNTYDTFHRSGGSLKKNDDVAFLKEKFHFVYEKARKKCRETGRLPLMSRFLFEDRKNLTGLFARIGLRVFGKESSAVAGGLAPARELDVKSYKRVSFSATGRPCVYTKFSIRDREKNKIAIDDLEGMPLKGNKVVSDPYEFTFKSTD